ncbi:MAG: hypothetical protein AW07_01570 [Candidatus Accumulibacter sp. SK-11]|nr:MAG: hypothetical protein AW07_01570 [Candidatus Accumulibacter sp. SK-11]
MTGGRAPANRRVTGTESSGVGPVRERQRRSRLTGMRHRTLPVGWFGQQPRDA